MSNNNQMRCPQCGSTDIDILEDEVAAICTECYLEWPYISQSKATIKDEYLTMIKMIHTRHKEAIVEANTNPDKWFELFVNEGDVGTHTVESADTLDEIAQHFEKYAEQYGFENVNIDIWENREHPNNLIGLFDTQIRTQSDTHRLDQNYLARVCLWVNNYGDGEGLTRELFAETYGKVMGNHYAVKWESDYRHNILAMVNYFGYGSKDGQKFCDMIMKQIAKYEQRINYKRNGR